MSVASALRELALGEDLTDKEAKEFADLADAVEVKEAAVSAGSAAPPVVGSDFSVFIRNISILGFIPALRQFVLDVFNIK
jgi:hypothetical protein